MSHADPVFDTWMLQTYGPTLVERGEFDADSMHDAYLAGRARVEEIPGEAKNLLAALRAYGRHEGSCPVIRPQLTRRGPCDCGLDSAIAHYSAVFEAEDEESNERVLQNDFSNQQHNTKGITMAVRAKFKLIEITATHWGSKRLKFSCEYDSTIPEDQRFQKATPTGSIEMQIDNPAAVEQFALGKTYYADFTPAEVAVPA